MTCFGYCYACSEHLSLLSPQHSQSYQLARGCQRCPQALHSNGPAFSSLPYSISVSGQVNVACAYAVGEQAGLCHRHPLVAGCGRSMDLFELRHTGTLYLCQLHLSLQTSLCARVCLKMATRNRSCTLPATPFTITDILSGLDSVTYLNTSAFALYLLPFVIRRSSEQSHEYAEGCG